MSTNRRARTATHARQKTTTGRTRQRGGGSQVALLGAWILMAGIVGAIGLALSAHNDTHPAVFWLPAIPIVGGLVLLIWGLARVVPRPGRASGPGEALEPHA